LGIRPALYKGAASPNLLSLLIISGRSSSSILRVTGAQKSVVVTDAGRPHHVEICLVPARSKDTGQIIRVPGRMIMPRIAFGIFVLTADVMSAVSCPS
jgi:hypothetical protein